MAEATGLRSLSGPARARVTDRAGWVHANVNSFQRLLRPLTDKLGDRMSESVASGVTRRFAGAEVGMLLGWMSTRVLGQYDLLVVEDPTDTAPDDQDLVYYVGPNVLALEKRFAFPPKEFRLWLALHEVTHRAQFTGVPWLREHYLGLVAADARLGRSRPEAVLRCPHEGARRSASRSQAARRRRPRHAPGQPGPARGARQDRRADEPARGARRRHDGPRRRRPDPQRPPVRTGAAGAARRRPPPWPSCSSGSSGIEAKINQYARGEAFITEVERLGGGPDALDPVWRGASWLPTLAEIKQPEDWLDRVRLSDELVG